MNILEKILSIGSVPISFHTINSLLGQYRRPNDKINELVKSQHLISLKRGHYAVGPKLKQIYPNPFLVSNAIYGPSYISFDTALSWHGIIPEKVFAVSAATTKPSNIFNNSIGIFEYIHLPLPYYSFGISQIKLSDNNYALMATPEKALFDKIIDTSGLQFTSAKNCLLYLDENLRADLDILKGFNTEIMQTWIKNAPKSNSLKLLIKTIEKL